MIGCVITTHASDIRPTGYGVLDRCIESLVEVLGDTCDIIIIDNGSTHPLGTVYEFDYVYRSKQVNGLTGAWNVGVNMAIEKGHDLICVMSDDIYFNDTFKNYEPIIRNHEHKDIGMYGTMTDSPTTFPNQMSATPRPGELNDVTNRKFPIHGWLFGFTREFYMKNNDNGMMFDNKYPFGGNEQHFQQRMWARGGRSFIIGDCLVHHEHLNAWRKIK